ncbi:hypothetical protein HK096_007397, partial [Nowakowskiella sp. JEL0078]
MNIKNDPISDVSNRFRLYLSEHVLGKAREYYRLYTLKGSNINIPANVLPVICLDVACDNEDELFTSKNQVIKSVSTSLNQYNKNRVIFTNTINWNKTLTLRSLVVQFSQPNIYSPATKLLQVLSQKENTYSDATTIAAIFYLACKSASILETELDIIQEKFRKERGMPARLKKNESIDKAISNKKQKLENEFDSEGQLTERFTAEKSISETKNQDEMQRITEKSLFPSISQKEISGINAM